MKKSNLKSQIIKNLNFNKIRFLSKIILAGLFSLSVITKALFSGNQVYNENNITKSAISYNQSTSFSITDSNLTINVNLLPILRAIYFRIPDS